MPNIIKELIQLWLRPLLEQQQQLRVLQEAQRQQRQQLQ
jgi:predicted RNA-binding protein YlqC (UPF0109 family)